jgi:hypothetical protein
LRGILLPVSLLPIATVLDQEGHKIGHRCLTEGVRNDYRKGIVAECSLAPIRDDLGRGDFVSAITWQSRRFDESVAHESREL